MVLGKWGPRIETKKQHHLSASHFLFDAYARYTLQRFLQLFLFYCCPSMYTVALLLKWAFSSTVTDILSANLCTCLSDIDSCSFSLNGSNLLHMLMEVAEVGPSHPLLIKWFLHIPSFSQEMDWFPSGSQSENHISLSNVDIFLSLPVQRWWKIIVAPLASPLKTILN